jgi:signal transduction histidine kinase
MDDVNTLVDELRQEKQNTEMASKAKSEFISRLAHELNNPLQAITGYAELIEAKSDNSQLIEYSSNITVAAQHQKELINEVKNLAMIEAGIIDINLSEVSITQVINDSYGMTRHLADVYNVTLLPPCERDTAYAVTADYKRLKQVFINLISNAIKYNKPGGEVTILTRNKSNGCIEIGVSDTGSGILSSDIPSLFEPFNRLGAEKTDIEGSGIGLPITRKIVELMGGHLSVESNVDKGSIFWVSLEKRVGSNSEISSPHHQQP